MCNLLFLSILGSSSRCQEEFNVFEYIENIKTDRRIKGMKVMAFVFEPFEFKKTPSFLVGRVVTAKDLVFNSVKVG